MLLLRTSPSCQGIIETIYAPWERELREMSHLPVLLYLWKPVLTTFWEKQTHTTKHQMNSQDEISPERKQKQQRVYSFTSVVKLFFPIGSPLKTLLLQGQTTHTALSTWGQAASSLRGKVTSRLCCKLAASQTLSQSSSDPWSKRYLRNVSFQIKRNNFLFPVQSALSPHAHSIHFHGLPFNYWILSRVLPTTSKRNARWCVLFTPKWHLTPLHAITQCSMDERAKFRFTALQCLYSSQHMTREQESPAARDALLLLKLTEKAHCKKLSARSLSSPSLWRS